MFATLAFVWQVWTWGIEEVALAVVFSVVVSLLISIPVVWLAAIIGDAKEKRPFIIAGVVSAFIGFGIAFMAFGLYLGEETVDQEIAYMFEAKGHEVASVDARQDTIQIRSSCGEVWRYDLLGSYSKGDLGIDSSSALHIHVSEVDSRGFTRTCPPPHEE